MQGWDWLQHILLLRVCAPRDVHFPPPPVCPPSTYCEPRCPPTPRKTKQEGSLGMRFWFLSIRKVQRRWTRSKPCTQPRCLCLLIAGIQPLYQNLCDSWVQGHSHYSKIHGYQSIRESDRATHGTGCCSICPSPLMSHLHSQAVYAR